MAAHGHFHWNERLASDVEKWPRGSTRHHRLDVQPMPMAKRRRRDLLVAILGGQPVSGPFPDQTVRGVEGVPDGWMLDLQVGRSASGVKKGRGGPQAPS